MKITSNGKHNIKLNIKNELMMHLKSHLAGLSLMNDQEETLIVKDQTKLIPSAKKSDLINLVHRDHYGLDKTIQNLKYKVWWPGM